MNMHSAAQQQDNTEIKQAYVRKRMFDNSIIRNSYNI